MPSNLGKLCSPIPSTPKIQQYFHSLSGVGASLDAPASPGPGCWSGQGDVPTLERGNKQNQ